MNPRENFSIFIEHPWQVQEMNIWPEKRASSYNPNGKKNYQVSYCSEWERKTGEGNPSVK